MAQLADQGLLDLGAEKLEYRMIGPRPDAAPTIIMLHEGLGSVGMWNNFPDKVAAATGCGVFVYSRAGYGQSSPAILPRKLDYMHDEANKILPRLLDAIGFQRGVLLGHSDGASIARDLCRQPSGSSHRRSHSDGAAFHRRGCQRDVDCASARGLQQRRPARASVEVACRMSTMHFAAGTMSGSITISGNGIFQKSSLISACRS